MTPTISRYQSRLARLRARVADFPARPGVYLHKDRHGDVIYVGKARDLRARVSSYLAARGTRDAKTVSLVEEIETIDYLTTANELEAILLENNLIKTHQPKFNILLRDDKSYPYLKVTLSEDYPRVVFTRRVNRKKGDLYFGPFFAGTARKILKLVQDQFRLRSCDIPIEDGRSALPRPCLYYDMHRCLGPCVNGLTSRDQYTRMADDVVLFLSGRNRELLETLKKRMYEAAEAESFELASHYRDLIRTTERILAEQHVASASADNVDVWGIHQEDGDVAIQILVLRDGSLVDRRQIFFEKVAPWEPGPFVSEVLQRFYHDNLFIPNEILVPWIIDEHELVQSWLTERKGSRVSLRVPVRGKGIDRLEFATRNAVAAHEGRFRKSHKDRLEIAAASLAEVLGYSGALSRIESFDISNIQGSDSVAGMVVFEQGHFNRKAYRVFNIRSVEGADDFRSMAEAVERRYSRVLQDGEGLPDLILIDGGKGQLNAAVSALDKLGIGNRLVAGLAKREEEVFVPNQDEPLRLSRREPALQLLQMVRDETHRFAVSSHRRRRAGRTLKSELSTLDGIGAKRQRRLLEHFGSLSAVRQASRQDLINVLGKSVGSSVFDQLHADS